MATERDPKFSYEPGDVILSSEPFAHVVLSDMLQIACSWCLKQKGYQKDDGEAVSSLKKCDACKMLVYCSKSCQREDWVKGFHKKECKLMAKILVAPSELIRLAARAVFKVRAGHGDASEEFPDGQKMNFNDLEHSLEDHRSIASITNNLEGKKLLINYAVMLVIKYLEKGPARS